MAMETHLGLVSINILCGLRFRSNPVVKFQYLKMYVATDVAKNLNSRLYIAQHLYSMYLLVYISMAAAALNMVSLLANEGGGNINPCGALQHSAVYLSIYLFIYLSIYLCIYLSIDRSIYLSIYLSIAQQIYIKIFLCKSVTIPFKPNRSDRIMHNIFL